MFQRLFAILLFGLFFGLCTPVRADPVMPGFIAANPPRPMPMLTFTDNKGGIHDLKSYKGHFIVLNLWATWCAPCVKEMPGLNNLRAAFDTYRTFDVIAVTEDHDGLAAAQSFYTRHNINHIPIFADPSGQAPALLHARGLPTTILIAPNGMELGRVEGSADWTAPETIAFIQAKMNQTY
jgi:thiol-disulfide isomerase/thioredoxin